MNQKLDQKLQPLKKREKIFVKKFVELDENGARAAYETYPKRTPNAARVKAHALLIKPNIIAAVEAERETLKSALEKNGITPDYLAKKVNILLTAKDKEGFKDYTAIDKGLKHATNIYGVEPLDSKSQNFQTYNFIFNSETQSKVKELEEAIKQRLINAEQN